MNSPYTPGTFTPTPRYDRGGTVAAAVGAQPYQQVSGVLPARSSLPSAVAITGWTANAEGQVTFAPGQIIDEVRQVNEHWWRGSVAGSDRGYFPAAAVQLIAPTSARGMPWPAAGGAPSSGGSSDGRLRQYGQQSLGALPSTVQQHQQFSPHIPPSHSSAGHLPVSSLPPFGGVAPTHSGRRVSSDSGDGGPTGEVTLTFKYSFDSSALTVAHPHKNWSKSRYAKTSADSPCEDVVDAVLRYAFPEHVWDDLTFTYYAAPPGADWFVLKEALPVARQVPRVQGAGTKADPIMLRVCYEAGSASRSRQSTVGSIGDALPVTSVRPGRRSRSTSDGWEDDSSDVGSASVFGRAPGMHNFGDDNDDDDDDDELHGQGNSQDYETSAQYDDASKVRDDVASHRERQRSVRKLGMTATTADEPRFAALAAPLASAGSSGSALAEYDVVGPADAAALAGYGVVPPEAAPGRASDDVEEQTEIDPSGSGYDVVPEDDDDDAGADARDVAIIQGLPLDDPGYSALQAEELRQQKLRERGQVSTSTSNRFGGSSIGAARSAAGAAGLTGIAAAAMASSMLSDLHREAERSLPPCQLCNCTIYDEYFMHEDRPLCSRCFHTKLAQSFDDPFMLLMVEQTKAMGPPAPVSKRDSLRRLPSLRKKSGPKKGGESASAVTSDDTTLADSVSPRTAEPTENAAAPAKKATKAKKKSRSSKVPTTTDDDQKDRLPKDKSSSGSRKKVKAKKGAR